MKDELIKWMQPFYQGSNLANKIELLSFNDKYSLFCVKGHSGYVGRISGSHYSPSEWFVFENLSPIINRSFGSLPNVLYSFEGRLTKEHKTKLKTDFDLTYDNSLKPKIVNEDNTYILAIDNDAFYGNRFTSPIYAVKLVKEEENAFITSANSSDKPIRINKNKNYWIKVKEEEIEAKKTELSAMIVEYSTAASKAEMLKRDIVNFLK